MNLKTAHIIFTCIFLSNINFLLAQTNKPKTIVKTFFEDVFLKEQSLSKVSDNYRYRKNLKKLSKTEESKRFQNHLSVLKSERKHLLADDKIIFSVENYKKYKSIDKWNFEKKYWKDTYVVFASGKVEAYVLLKKSKIVSFIYFRKSRDDIAYFIPYYLKLRGSK